MQFWIGFCKAPFIYFEIKLTKFFLSESEHMHIEDKL